MLRNPRTFAAATAALLLVLTACAADQPTAPGAGPNFAPKGSQGTIKTLGVGINTSSIAPVTIDGAPFSYQFTLTNDFKDRSEIVIAVSVEEGLLFSGTIERLVERFHADCGAGDGIVLRRAVCTISRSGTVSNSTTGVGTLTPGSAQLIVRVYQGFTTPVLENFTFGALTLVSQ